MSQVKGERVTEEEQTKGTSKKQEKQPKEPRKQPNKRRKVKYGDLERWQAARVEQLGIYVGGEKTGLELKQTPAETREFLASLINRLMNQPPFYIVQDTLRKASPKGGAPKPGASLLGDVLGYVTGWYLANETAAKAGAITAAYEYQARREGRENPRGADPGANGGVKNGAGYGESPPSAGVPPSKEQVEEAYGSVLTNGQYEQFLMANGYVASREEASGDRG